MEKKISWGPRNYQTGTRQAVLGLLQGMGMKAEDYYRWGVSPTYLDNFQGGALEALLFSHSPSL